MLTPNDKRAIIEDVRKTIIMQIVDTQSTLKRFSTNDDDLKYILETYDAFALEIMQIALTPNMIPPIDN